MRPTSTSAETRTGSSEKRSELARQSPSSWMVPCPSQARSVVLSPVPAAEKTYADIARADCDEESRARWVDLPIVTLDAERLMRTVAPAKAANELGGMGAQ